MDSLTLNSTQTIGNFFFKTIFSSWLLSGRWGVRGRGTVGKIGTQSATISQLSSSHGWKVASGTQWKVQYRVLVMLGCLALVIGYVPVEKRVLTNQKKKNPKKDPNFLWSFRVRKIQRVQKIWVRRVRRIQKPKVPKVYYENEALLVYVSHTPSILWCLLQE